MWSQCVWKWCGQDTETGLAVFKTWMTFSYWKAKVLVVLRVHYCLRVKTIFKIKHHKNPSLTAWERARWRTSWLAKERRFYCFCIRHWMWISKGSRSDGIKADRLALHSPFCSSMSNWFKASISSLARFWSVSLFCICHRFRFSLSPVLSVLPLCPPCGWGIGFSSLTEQAGVSKGRAVGWIGRPRRFFFLNKRAVSYACFHVLSTGTAAGLDNVSQYITCKSSQCSHPKTMYFDVG